jgi:hypothetical protein
MKIKYAKEVYGEYCFFKSGCESPSDIFKSNAASLLLSWYDRSFLVVVDSSPCNTAQIAVFTRVPARLHSELHPQPSRFGLHQLAS